MTAGGGTVGEAVVCGEVVGVVAGGATDGRLVAGAGLGGGPRLVGRRPRRRAGGAEGEQEGDDTALHGVDPVAVETD